MFYSSSISIITDCAATKIQSYGFVLGEGEALFAQCGYSLSICANFRRHKSISFFIQNANISFSICSQHALAHTVKDVADTAAASVVQGEGGFQSSPLLMPQRCDWIHSLTAG